MPKKKLIEAALPVSVINKESEKEKSARGGQPSNVHLWWSRRPLAAARSVLFASIVDDPVEHPELFPSEEEQAIERQRLIQIVTELSTIEWESHVGLLKVVQNEIQRYGDGALPKVFDPFVGGGSIPIEARKLGLNVESSDLNPVAVMITKLLTDIPARFSNTVPVHPQERFMLEVPISGSKGYAEDIHYYGNWMISEAKARIGYLYPSVTSPETGKNIEVAAWIWARTVKCPNPSCNCEIPLASSYDLAKNRGCETWVEPYVQEGTIRFRIHHEANSLKRSKPKVAQTAVFRCPVCEEITTDAYVKECGNNHQIHSQLIAIVADDGKKRLYLEACQEQEAISKVAQPTTVPHGGLPNYPRRFAPPSFGLRDYADLFTNRQLTFLTTMMNLACEVQDLAEKAAIEKGMPNDGIAFAQGGSGALAYAEAIRIALVLTVSKLLDRCSNICSWDSSSGGSLRNVFSRAAMPMIWDYAEANPFSSASGSFLKALERTCESIAVLPSGGTSLTIVHDGTVSNDVRDAILSTELPFYDKAGYADLSDFFYVWIRFGLGDLFPEYFQTEVTLKKEELTAFAYRWNGDRQQANAFYKEGLNSAFKNLYESVTDSYPSTVAFQYKRSDTKDFMLSEWETFVSAICNAGFMITASWPLARNDEVAIELAEARGLPITVVIRRKPINAQQTTRRFFVAAVKREVPILIDRLLKQVDIKDLRASIIGQALNIYSRYSKVLDADGSVMRPHMASRIIEQELDTLLQSRYNYNNDVKEETKNV